MDTSGSGSQPSSSEIAELRQQIISLQNLLVVTLAGLVVLCGGLGGFVFKQLRIVRQNLDEQRPVSVQRIRDYQAKSEPLIRNFSTAMSQFAATNQSFRPIVDRYRPLLSNYMTGPVSSAGSGTPAQTNP